MAVARWCQMLVTMTRRNLVAGAGMSDAVSGTGCVTSKLQRDEMAAASGPSGLVRLLIDECIDEPDGSAAC